MTYKENFLWKGSILEFKKFYGDECSFKIWTIGGFREGQ